MFLLYGVRSKNLREVSPKHCSLGLRVALPGVGVWTAHGLEGRWMPGGSEARSGTVLTHTDGSGKSSRAAPGVSARLSCDFFRGTECSVQSPTSSLGRRPSSSREKAELGITSQTVCVKGWSPPTVPLTGFLLCLFLFRNAEPSGPQPWGADVIASRPIRASGTGAPGRAFPF